MLSRMKSRDEIQDGIMLGGLAVGMVASLVEAADSVKPTRAAFSLARRAGRRGRPTSAGDSGPTRQERGQQPEEQEERTEPIHGPDAREVRELAERRRPQTSQPEREPIEHPRREP